MFKKDPLVTLGKQKFYLNNSKTKFVSVEFLRLWEFIPYIQTSENKNDRVVFDEKEWEHFHKHIKTVYAVYNENEEWLKILY